jgi:hypothetical protein
MAFKPGREFRRKYHELFKKDPLLANTFLLLCELAYENGQVTTNEEELAEFMVARFEEYAL